jgi:hypothetical protein
MFEFKRVKIDYKKLRLSNHDYIFTYISRRPCRWKNRDQKRPRAIQVPDWKNEGKPKIFSVQVLLDSGC